MIAIFSTASLLLLVVGYLLSIFENRYKRSVSVLLAFFLLFSSVLLLTFRGFGLDFGNYSNMYQAANFDVSIENLFSLRIEPGFALAMNVFRDAGLSFNFFYTVINTIALIMVFYAYGAEKFSVSLVVIFLIVFFFGYIDVTRAFFVSCGFILCLRFYTERKIFLFSVLILFLPLMHYSFFVFWILFFFLKIRFSCFRYILLILTSFFFGLMLRYIIEDLSYRNFEVGSLGFLKTGLMYLMKDNEGPEEGFLNVTHVVTWYFVLAFIPVISIVINFFAINKKLILSNKKIILIHRCSCWGTMFFVFFASAGSIVMANRLFYLLSLGLPLVIRALYTHRDIYCRDKVDGLKFQILVLVIAFGVIISFSYVVHAYVPGTLLYLGI